MLNEILAVGDKVFYTGTKFKQELSGKEGKPYPGWIHAATTDNPDVFVVEFPDTKDGASFVMHISLLKKARLSKTDKHGPEIELRPIRRRKGEDE